MRRFVPVLTAYVLAMAGLPRAQDQSKPPEFDVVSIKRSAAAGQGGGGRTLPDGTQQMTNFAIRQFILGASPVPTQEVIGLPDWATTERYDIVLKPPAGSTPQQRRQMTQTMFASVRN